MAAAPPVPPRQQRQVRADPQPPVRQRPAARWDGIFLGEDVLRRVLPGCAAAAVACWTSHAAAPGAAAAVCRESGQAGGELRERAERRRGHTWQHLQRLWGPGRECASGMCFYKDSGVD